MRRERERERERERATVPLRITVFSSDIAELRETLDAVTRLLDSISIPVLLESMSFMRMYQTVRAAGSRHENLITVLQALGFSLSSSRKKRDTSLAASMSSDDVRDMTSFEINKSVTVEHAARLL